MTRVSENSTTQALKYNLSKTKERMENLQLKGSSLKAMVRPSDNPINNVEAMSLESRMKDHTQYIRNSEYAELHLQSTEKAIEQLVDIINKAKEIAIAQSSDFYDVNIRKNVANEIQQLRNQTLSIANKRVGNKYLFGGFKTLTKPFDKFGTYKGDLGKITIEITKDFFVPINLNGFEVFYAETDTSSKQPNPFERVGPEDGAPNKLQKSENINSKETQRDLASQREKVEGKYDYQNRVNLFSILDSLSSSLENNDSAYTQSLLEKFDDALSRLVTMRTKIGSIMNSVSVSKVSNEDDKINAAERKSKITDADITELLATLQGNKTS